MATEIRVPTLGESVSEATIGKWFKKAGDSVKADEPLVELETDKVTLEVNAPAAGVLAEITVKDGETVTPGALLGQISEGGAGASNAVAPAKSEAKVKAPPPASTAAQAPAASRAAAAATNGGQQSKSAPTQMPPAPSAAKIAAERGVDTGEIAGSGKRGQVLKADVLAFTPASAPTASRDAAPAQARAPAPPEDAPREERVRMTKLRQTIARRLKEAQSTAAMLTTFNEVDMSGVMSLRSHYKDLFEKKHAVKLGFMGFFVKACTQALKEIPNVNAEIDGTDIVYKNFCHIGVAVGTDKGLVVPVVRDADRKSIAEVEKAIADFGRRARDGQLKIDEMQGGTFTISNGGVYGSLMSTPILNAPQSGILGMHKIQERPVAVGGKV
ncbi:MAG: 2-oxoglutarate dehydrogenase complex dihydrolipoyllysine-residue succinyltransferase, partial [Methylobacteriaceae bacterium]|nr:2-oxoglutarate dehydrogenase complex dihydrolipoyllysine-residue succinyltransferase [Methylobacteriaceae bacterium]